MGTQILYQGEGQVVADVVFVHGLRGDAIKTWSEGSTCWPRDFLQYDVPNTRIITWGYDSNIAKVTEFSSQNSIFGHAENLLSDLAMKRRKPEEKLRPIIFVGHSLGGLVIKEALIRSSEYLNNGQDLRLGSIYNCTSGVVFLGTPHRGSDKEGLGQIVANIAAFALRQPNEKLLKNLDKESDVLERQRRSFASISEKLPVVCLWEEKPMAIGIIVPEWSASIDGFKVKSGSIPANHSEMCKYKDVHTPGYQRTSGHIMNLVDVATERMTSDNLRKMEATAKCAEMATNAVLRSLQFRGMNDRHDQIEEAHKQSFEWIYKQGAFLQWLEHSQGIFWINGKAGAGKSTLMKFLFNNPRTKLHLGASPELAASVFAGFFFHDRGTTLQKSQTGLLKSILHQIISQCRDIAEIACGERWKVVNAWYLKDPDRFFKGDIAKEPALPEWSHTELLRTFKAILQQSSIPLGLLLFIDGLDEYEGDKDDILGLLDAVLSTTDHRSRIQLCLSSRPWNVFEEAFGRCPHLRLQDLTYKDIRMYVAGSLYHRERMKELARIDSESASRLIEDIVERADGVFLWVKLVVKSLINGLRNYDSIADLQKRLGQFPVDLEPLYRRMLDDIEDMYVEQAIQFFQITQSARKAPKTLSLWYENEGELTGIDNFTVEYITPEDSVVRCKEVDGRLRSRCAGLIEIQFTGAFSYEETMQYGSLQAESRFPQSRFALVESTVQYLHQTVKDYLDQPDVTSVLLRRCPNFRFDAHRWLQRSYLREIRDMRGSPFQVFMTKRDTEPGMLWEPLEEFMYHTKMIEEATGIAQTLLLESVDTMLKSEACRVMLKEEVPQPGRNNHWSGWWAARAPSSYPAAQNDFASDWNHSFLTFTVCSGLQRYVEEVLERPGFRINDRRGRPLLHFAIIPGSKCPPCPDPVGMVKLLMRHGANPRLMFRETVGETTMKICALDFVRGKLQGGSLNKAETQLFRKLQVLLEFRGSRLSPHPQSPPTKLSRESIIVHPRLGSASNEDLLSPEPRLPSIAGTLRPPPKASPSNNTSEISMVVPSEPSRNSSMRTREDAAVMRADQRLEEEGAGAVLGSSKKIQTSRRHARRHGGSGCFSCFCSS